MLQLQFLDGWNCHSIYKVNGELEGFIEVQFDDGEFNGVILFSSDDINDEEQEWKDVVNVDAYEFIKDKAIKDYNGNKQ